MKPASLRIRFWGVRGSYPTPGPSTVKIGGNSSCVQIDAAGRTLVFDAGTGLINLGNHLIAAEGTRDVHIFLSHTHHDHIEGLRFFQPLYRDDWRCHLYGPGPAAERLARTLRETMAPRFFPVSFDELSARVTVRSVGERLHVRLSARNGAAGAAVLAQHCAAHPKGGVILYRVTSGGRTAVYATDVEAARGGADAVAAFAKGADVLIHDAQYTDTEYEEGHLTKAGWGHSTVRQAAEVAKAADVGELLLYHHDPQHDDAQVRRMERLAQRIFPRSRAACEGLELRV